MVDGFCFMMREWCLDQKLGIFVLLLLKFMQFLIIVAISCDVYPEETNSCHRCIDNYVMLLAKFVMLCGFKVLLGYH